MSAKKAALTPATPPATESDETTVAPKKTRTTTPRTRRPKAADAPASEATVSTPPPEPPPAVEEQPATPKKRTRSRAKKTTESEVVAPVAAPEPVVEPEAAATPAKKRAPRTSKKKVAAVEIESQLPPATVASPAPAADLAPEPTPIAPPAEVSAEPQEVKEPGKSRQRSRKRPNKSGKATTASSEPETPAEEELAPPPPAELPPAISEAPTTAAEPSEGEATPAPAKRGKRRNRKSSAKKAAAAPAAAQEGEESDREELDEEREAEESEEQEPEKPAIYKLLINAEEPEECRIALLENGKLESFHVETVVNALSKGNIYKGKIVAVEANLQAAFVDLGTGKNGFLPFSDIHPEYYNREISANTHWKELHIQDVVSKGTEVLVEVVKETTGNKGANLTTFLSLPGRFVVLMPGSDSHGISRKIDDEEQRSYLREMMSSCNLPEGVGYIIRTASKDITKAALTNDVKFLLNLWKEIKHRGQTMPSPALVYQEEDIIARFLRDHFTPEIHEILVDSQAALDQVANFLELLPVNQRKETTVKLHRGSRPIINQYNVEEQIEQIYQPTVKLPSGGSIVINPTEALVAIDVNSGRTSKDKNFDETIFLANMEAAEELGRQLRLRDLGGLIVVDFIDMRIARHIREVEKKVKSSMKRDKAKVDFSRISKFGLMQISRQRLGAPIQAGNYNICSHCQGRGITRSVETQALACLRQIQTAVTRKNVGKITCRLPVAPAQYLLNKKRTELGELEKLNEVEIFIEADATMTPEQVVIDVQRKEAEGRR